VSYEGHPPAHAAPAIDLDRCREMIVESMSEGAVVVDRHEMFAFANPAALQLFGGGLDEVFSRPALPIFQHERLGVFSSVDHPIRLTLRDGARFWIRDANFVRTDGGRFPVNYLSTPIRAADGAILGALIVFSDATDRDQLESRLRLAEKGEVVGQLCCGLAHDFNNMLGVILALGELLERDPGAVESVRQQAAEIVHVSSRASLLSRQLLQLGDSSKPVADVLDLNQHIAALRAMLERLIGQRCRLHMALEPDLPAIHAAPQHIEQIIMNLCANARDAIAAHGTITIRTCGVNLDQEQARWLGGLSPGYYVVLEVADDGAGMSEAVRSRIFDSFFTTKPIGRGAGTGLTTCRRLVTELGGCISVESEPGRGATFRIHLPSSSHTPAGSAGEEMGTLDPRGSETLLLIEDDAELRSLTARSLEHYGYRVLEAASAAEAFRQFFAGAEPIALVIADIALADMSATKLAGWLRAQDRTLRFLFTSAAGREGLMPTVTDPDLQTDFLPKPFAPSILARKVRTLLDAPPQESD
jgi:two-component system, cell cycle sensor histidine kinase and response regulator CckA